MHIEFQLKVTETISVLWVHIYELFIALLIANCLVFILLEGD